MNDGSKYGLIGDYPFMRQFCPLRRPGDECAERYFKPGEADAVAHGKAAGKDGGIEFDGTAVDHFALETPGAEKIRGVGRRKLV